MRLNWRNSIAAMAALATLALIAIACTDGEQLPQSAPEAETSPAVQTTPSSTDPTPAPTAMTTSNSSASSVRFAVKGDWGDGSFAQATVTGRMCEWRETTGFTYVLTTGDNFYDPDGSATDSNYYNPERCLYSDPRHRWRASWGNHDDGSSTGDVLLSPSQPRYYSWTVGDIAFFAYDGNDVSQAQREWLRNAVCSSTAAVKVLYGHQSPYSTGSHGSDLVVREMVHPVARDCDARLVLSGHDHLYERSFPIEGVTYIVTGGGGANPHECRTAEDWVAICLSRHHFLYVEVDSNSIRVRTVGTDGQVFDSVDIQR